MATTYFDTVETPHGEFMLLTKNKAFFGLADLPNTSITPRNPMKLATHGVQLKWEISKVAELAAVHKAILEFTRWSGGIDFLVALRHHVSLLIRVPGFEFNPLIRHGLLGDMLEQVPEAQEANTKLIVRHIKGIQ